MSSAPTLQRHSSISRYAAKAFSKFHFLCARNLTKSTWSIDDILQHLKFRIATTHSFFLFYLDGCRILHGSKPNSKSKILALTTSPMTGSNHPSHPNPTNASSTKDHDVLVPWDSLTSLVSQPRWHVGWHPFHPRWDNWSHLHSCMFHSSVVVVMPFGGSKTNALKQQKFLKLRSNKPKGEMSFFPRKFAPIVLIVDCFSWF